MGGIFGKMFDYNRNGKLDAFERAMEMDFLSSLEHEEEDDEQLTELEMAGIDPGELEYMNESERREILEDEGLDPDDYDF